MSENIYSVKIDGPGMEFSREVNESQVLQILAVSLGQDLSSEMRQTSDAAPQMADESIVTKRKSPSVTVGEFISTLEVSNNPERIAAIVLFLQEHHNKQLVSKDVLPEWFQRAGATVPANLSRDLGKAVKRNLIAEDHQKSYHYFVTNTGKQYLGYDDD